MKKLTILLVLLFLPTGCMSTDHTTLPGTTVTVSTQQSTTGSAVATTAPSSPISFLLYMPDENLESFVSMEMTLESLPPDLIVQALIDNGVLASDVQTNHVAVDGVELVLDMNEAFLMQLYTMSTTGEKMLIGCLVNTFLSAYGCEYLKLTVDGEIINSGHVEYSEPLYPFH